MWTVEILDETVEAELRALPAALQQRLTRIVEHIELLGLEQMREPHVKHLRGKVWEIRAKGHDGIARALYIVAKGKRVVIVLVFMKKTQKTPPNMLALAEYRAEKFKEKDEKKGDSL